MGCRSRQARVSFPLCLSLAHSDLPQKTAGHLAEENAEGLRAGGSVCSGEVINVGKIPVGSEDLLQHLSALFVLYLLLAEKGEREGGKATLPGRAINTSSCPPATSPVRGDSEAVGVPPGQCLMIPPF